MKFRVIALLASLLVFVSGCTSSIPGENESTDVVLGLTYIPDVQFAPVYLAEANGYFEDERVNVTIRHHGAQESLFGALSSGEEDIVFAGAAEMVQARSTGIDVVNWATLYQRYPVALLTRAESGIAKPEDLKGKTVGLPGPYGETYYALLAVIDQYDLGNDVDITYIGYTQSAALNSGEVDAVVGYANNDAVSMRAAGMDVTEIALDDLPLISVGLGSLATDMDPETYAKVLRAIERGVEDAKSDPEAAMDVVATYVPSLSDPQQRATAREVLDATISLYGAGDTFGAQEMDRWAHMCQFLANADITTTLVPVEDVVTADVLDLRTDS